MTMPHHRLADDVFMCLSDHRIVFLDLHRNQYLCLNRRNTQIAISLFTHSAGRGVRPPGETNAFERTSSKDTGPIVQALRDRGLLAQDGSKGKKAAPVRIEEPEHTLLLRGSGPKPAVNSGHWAAFLHASLKASWKLRWYSMQRTVRSIENRKKRHSKWETADNRAVPEFVAIFHRLRPYYARKYLCLYDSLALVEFLAHYRIFPQWVFGVTAGPFNAHCWVQEGDCILNDTVEYVQGFTPIMAV